MHDLRDIVDTSIIGRYSKIINDHPVLSKLEERRQFKLLRKFKNGKQRQIIRDKIFNSNISLVMKYASQYCHNSNIPLEDLIGAGNIGLAEAIDRFDYKRGYKFSTYAVHWIKLHIFDTLNLMSRSVSVPPYIIEKARKHNVILNEKNISEKELKKQMSVSEKVLSNIKASKVRSISLDQTYGEDKENTLYDFIPDTKSVPENRDLMDEDRHQVIREVINELSHIQKKVIVSRYLRDDKNNLKEIGKQMNLTGERVRQIEVKALRRLKLKMRQRGFLNLNQVSHEL